MKNLLLVILILVIAGTASAQAKLRLTAVRGSSGITLSFLKKSVKIDLDAELGGSNGTLPGDEPHRYAVLFTTEKDGFLYLVARVCSASPISDKNAPCGGDHPCGILWIKIDKALKHPEMQSEIYESCSYNYNESIVKLTATGLEIRYDRGLKVLTYDNAEPGKGLVLYAAVRSK